MIKANRMRGHNLYEGIVFDTRLRDWEDTRKVKGLLVELSGRKIEDFEQTMYFRKS